MLNSALIAWITYHLLQQHKYNQGQVFALCTSLCSCSAMATSGGSLHLCGITLSIDAVDSVLVLRIVPAESAFSTDW